MPLKPGLLDIISSRDIWRVYLDMGLVVVAHGHLPELIANANHGVVKNVRNGFIFVEALNGFLNEIKADAVLVAEATQ